MSDRILEFGNAAIRSGLGPDGDEERIDPESSASETDDEVPMTSQRDDPLTLHSGHVRPLQ